MEPILAYYCVEVKGPHSAPPSLAIAIPRGQEERSIGLDHPSSRNGEHSLEYHNMSWPSLHVRLCFALDVFCLPDS